MFPVNGFLRPGLYGFLVDWDEVVRMKPFGLASKNQASTRATENRIAGTNPGNRIFYSERPTRFDRMMAIWRKDKCNNEVCKSGPEHVPALQFRPDPA